MMSSSFDALGGSLRSNVSSRALMDPPMGGGSCGRPIRGNSISFDSSFSNNRSPLGVLGSDIGGKLSGRFTARFGALSREPFACFGCGQNFRDLLTEPGNYFLGCLDGGRNCHPFPVVVSNQCRVGPTKNLGQARHPSES